MQVPLTRRRIFIDPPHSPEYTINRQRPLGNLRIEGTRVGTVGNANFIYNVVDRWGKLSYGHEFGQVAGVATDSEGMVHLFNRSNHPIQIFDPVGNFVREWGDERSHEPGKFWGPMTFEYALGEIYMSAKS